MIHINLLTNLRQKLFEKQLPGDIEKYGVVFKINSRDDIVWDLVVVYEEIDETWTIKHKENGLLFISGEPPIVRVYSEMFLNQFNYIISAHPCIKHDNSFLTQQSLPWYFGYDFPNDFINYSFDDLLKMLIPSKKKKISFITSNRMFLPGHHSRIKFHKELQKRYSDHIDFFGKGFSPVDDKAEVINPYFFSICIENSNINDYWTEKITDAFLGYSIPLYYGCKNINSYFSEESFIPIDIKDRKTTFSIIDNLIQNTEAIYNEKISYAIESRKKCLYEYNTFFSILSFAKKNILNSPSDKIICAELRPSTMFHDNKFASKYLKTKRIISKRLIKIFT